MEYNRLRIRAALQMLLVAAFSGPVAALQVTDNPLNEDDRWSANSVTNHGGKLLWYVEVNGDPRDVYHFDGSVPTLIQAHDPNVASLGLIGTTVFGLGSGAAPDDVIGAWRRGANYAWVWTSGQAPIEVDTVGANLFDDDANPLPTNPEGVAIADGCAFMIMQANAGGVFPNHVFAVDPSTGSTHTVSGSARVKGVDEVRTSECKAVWVFDPNDEETTFDLPLELQYFDGSTTTTLDLGPLSYSEIDFYEGKVLYVKEALGIEQVFLIDMTQSDPVPEQLSNGLRPKRNPQTDGRHVAWAEYDKPFNDSAVEIVLLGDHMLNYGVGRAPGQIGPYPFWLDHGQLVWGTAFQQMRVFANNTMVATPDLSPGHPRISLGKIAYFEQANDGESDTEIFLVSAGAPTLGQPSPPILLDAELGNGKVTLRWDRVIGATGYNVYYAEEPGVLSTNYTNRVGGTRLQDVTSPLVVDRLDNSKTYYFTVTTDEDGVEGPDSGEATSDGFIVDSFLDEFDANADDGLCLSTSGVCTLRAAITQASRLNRDMTVVVPAGTYALTQSPYTLFVTGHVRIGGDGQGITVIEGDPSEPVIVTTEERSVRLAVRDLTIRNGIQGIRGWYDILLERVTLEDNGAPTSSERGAGVELLGLNATLIDCEVANNISQSHGGGALFGQHPDEQWTRVVRTEFHDNTAGLGGGGFYNIFANVHLIDSDVHDNSSRFSGFWAGGGIVNERKLTVVGSSIHGNEAGDGGGGIYGVVGETVIVNSTISANHADNPGGGLSVWNASLSLYNVTVNDNTTGQTAGASLWARGLPTMQMRHTIFNNGEGKPNCQFNQGHGTSVGYNLESGDSCNFFSSTDRVNTDPLLSPLAYNGGPTPTHALQAGSPALDGGDPTGCLDPFAAAIAVDQRGAARPFDGDASGDAQCDLGAVESLGACTDIDGDGFVAGLDPACQIANDADCDDSDGAVYPGAPQVCDGVNNDCSHAAWPAVDGTNEADGDGDLLSTCTGDCLDEDGTVWATPGEVLQLLFSSAASLSWSTPDQPGGTADALRYDVTRASSAADLSLDAACLEQAQSGQTASDTATPSIDQVFYYLVRARNGCPDGVGSWGTMSDGAERSVEVCP